MPTLRKLVRLLPLVGLALLFCCAGVVTAELVHAAEHGGIPDHRHDGAADDGWALEHCHASAPAGGELFLRSHFGAVLSAPAPAVLQAPRGLLTAILGRLPRGIPRQHTSRSRAPPVLG